MDELTPVTPQPTEHKADQNLPTAGNASTNPVFDMANKVLAYSVAVAKAAMENEAAAQAELAEKDATINTLTDLAYDNEVSGLPNKRAFFTELDDRIAQNRKLAIAILDITQFKAANDHYGHDVGDDILRGTGKLVDAATCLKEHSRDDDFVAHLSGDEFAIIFDMEPREDDTLTPEERLESIRKNIMQYMTEFVHTAGLDKLGVNIAIGIAHKNGYETAKELRHAADADMYKHKEQQHKDLGTPVR